MPAPSPNVSPLSVLKITGAFIAFLFGSGFATGQEVMQFFASSGIAGVAAVIVFLVLAAYLSITLLLVGQDQRFQNVDEVFRYFAGDTLGRLFSWYTILLLFSIYALMLAGAGSVLHEQYGVPVYVGSGLMALVVLVSLFFGLHELIDIIGAIGPLLALFVIYVAVTVLLKEPGAVASGAATIPGLEMLRASQTWWMSGLLYTALNVYGLFSFLPAVGATVDNRKDLIVAGILGPLVYAAALGVATLAFISLLPEINGRLIPMLYLVDSALPALTPLFAWVVLAGIFTTTAPVLWIVLVRFTPDGSRRYKWLALALSVSGFFACQLLPFDKLVNLIYPTVGYFGLLLIVCMLVKQARSRAGV
ncbi:hypothetical protein E2F43_17540 [Seongchinamella unica]|uniref:Membrane protein YkvI n=1 Tax=Seongchinamella unica TaxID=2547392 RepID=A0A4R5LPD0_9GAMM|nr:hypothetical protein [Seongchinamella unica]TDG12150.1 hypothetical protein E2F43_17540 [Seongchinamella unica]